LIFFNNFSIYCSSSQDFLDASIKYKIISASSKDFKACSFIALLKSFSDLCIPGVSRKII
jgi:hypothetical protein